MKSTKHRQDRVLRIASHVIGLLPLTQIGFAYFTNTLTVNPIQDLTLRTGKAALIMLMLSLAATPIQIVFKFNPVLKTRRTMGLYAFFYAAIHFLIFLVLDYGLNLTYILEAVFEKRYALVGFAAFLILLPLAITSTKGWKRRLKKNWIKLHRWIYLAGFLVIVHYVWLVKSDIREPLAWGVMLTLFLVLRSPAVRAVFRNNPSRRGRPSETAIPDAQHENS
jgi:sulfoxide reductase heme-binding subunit YedZ